MPAWSCCRAGRGRSVVTDAFGDFRFDGLAAASGPHELRIAHPAHGSTRLAVDLAASSVVLGDVRLGAS